MARVTGLRAATSATTSGTIKFSLSEEQAFTLATEDSPAYLPGAFELALGSLEAVPRIAESFRTGTGMGWHEHVDGVFHGCEKFFRPAYAANLVSSWIPALHDVQEKLENGARVADVGCGKGASTLLMAKAFTNSRFFGFDYHDKSIEAARRDSACRKFRTEQSRVRSLIGDPSHCCKAQIDRGRCQQPLLQVDPVPQHDGAIERESRFRTIPVDELGDGVLVRSLSALRSQAVYDRRLRLFEIWKGKNSLRRFLLASGLGQPGRPPAPLSARMLLKFYPSAQ